MATSAPTTTHLLLLLLSLFAAARSETVHDLLTKFGLPPGLLPDAVKSYSLSANGEFVVELTSTCYVHFSNLVYYEKKITGKVSYGKITDISGIQAKKLFVWVSVTGIVAKPEAGVIEFKVGFLSDTLPTSEFQTVPACKSRVGCRGADGILGEDRTLAAAASVSEV